MTELSNDRRLNNGKYYQNMKTIVHLVLTASVQAYPNELPYEYMLALCTTALIHTHRKSWQLVCNCPKHKKTDAESNIFSRIVIIENLPA